VLDANMIPTGEREAVEPISGPLGDRVFDNGYDEVPAGAKFALVGGGHRVVVRFDEGYPCAQVFAPPHMDVVCFEPMAAPTNALASGDGLRWAEPGQPFRAVFSVRVERG
jgi:galactose mutarotase-like enzyme